MVAAETVPLDFEGDVLAENIGGISWYGIPAPLDAWSCGTELPLSCPMTELVSSFLLDRSLSSVLPRHGFLGGLGELCDRKSLSDVTENEVADARPDRGPPCDSRDSVVGWRFDVIHNDNLHRPPARLEF